MASATARGPSPSWRDRFYTIEGQRVPSVTTVLDIIAKPALGPWYAKEERRYFETAMLEVLSRPGARDPEYVLAAVAEAVTGVKAADREKQKAAAIGTAVHAGIEWELRRHLGEDAGPEPRLPEMAAWGWRAGRTGPGPWAWSLWPSSEPSTAWIVAMPAPSTSTPGSRGS